VLQSQITDLQSNIVVTGTNLALELRALEQLTTGTNNIAIGSGAANGQYGLTTGSGNVMLGINSGQSCVVGSNNTFLGYNTSMYEQIISLSQLHWELMQESLAITNSWLPPMSPSSTYPA